MMTMKPLLLPLPGPRKEALLSLTPPCGVAADIGADHGITAAHLLLGGIARRLLVTDISAASLAKARRLFALHGLQTKADFHVADGLDALASPVDAILITGLGADTIKTILRRGLKAIGKAALILQSQGEPTSLRRWLMENGFRIEAEVLALEDGRFYVALRARRGRAAYSEKELLLGPCLLRDKPPHYDAYLAWRRDCLLATRREDMQQAIEWIKEALTP